MSSLAKQKAFVTQLFEKLHKFEWAMNIWSRLVNAEMHKSSLFWGTKTIQSHIAADTLMYLGQLESRTHIWKLYILFLQTCNFLNLNYILI